MMKRPINDIEAMAAEWVAREDGGPLSAERELERDLWLNEDPRHMGAYLKMRATLLRVERLGSAALQSRQRQPGAWAFIHTLRQDRWRYAVAGGVSAFVAVMALAVLVWNANSYDAVLRTLVGQTKVASMPDGSLLTLNTDSEVVVHYSPLVRDVTLKHGEVLFDVAKHKRPPFVVAVGDTQVRAVGTSFAVSNLIDKPMSVMVREGAIEIINSHSPHAVAVGSGSRAEARSDGRFVVAALSPVQAAHDLDWLGGRIFFRRQTLASAAKEFERYSTLRIVITDPAVARKTVTGVFVATDPAAFAKAASAVLDLEVSSTGKTLLLSQKHR